MIQTPDQTRETAQHSRAIPGRRMIERILTVGGFTLASRVTGFFRDILMAAVLGAGPIADAFLVAFRLPNHFRAIFAEGAFNAAFVPAYARIRQQGGTDPARLFADRVFTILFGFVGVLVVLALIFTPAGISLLSPGFSEDPGRFALVTELTRITFPYLLLMSLVTLYGGILNALARFAAAAAAPILLNTSMMAALALAVFFRTPGHAAAWGVLIASRASERRSSLRYSSTSAARAVGSVVRNSTRRSSGSASATSARSAGCISSVSSATLDGSSSSSSRMSGATRAIITFSSSVPVMVDVLMRGIRVPASGWASS
jgi:hypothetical protein